MLDVEAYIAVIALIFRNFIATWLFRKDQMGYAILAGEMNNISPGDLDLAALHRQREQPLAFQRPAFRAHHACPHWHAEWREPAVIVAGGANAGFRFRVGYRSKAKLLKHLLGEDRLGDVP